MTESDPRKLLVLGFDSPLLAQEAFLAMTRLAQSGQILVQDAVFIHKRDDGKVKVSETIDISPGDAALSSSLWGALLGTIVGGPIGLLAVGAVSAGIGALVARFTDIGVPDGTVKSIGEALAPAKTALALLLSHIDEDALATELKRFAGATIVQSSLSEATVAALRASVASPAA
jgi:uncharacterized membrane protein